MIEQTLFQYGLMCTDILKTLIKDCGEDFQLEGTTPDSNVIKISVLKTQFYFLIIEDDQGNRLCEFLDRTLRVNQIVTAHEDFEVVAKEFLRTVTWKRFHEEEERIAKERDEKLKVINAARVRKI